MKAVKCDICQRYEDEDQPNTVEFLERGRHWPTTYGVCDLCFHELLSNLKAIGKRVAP
jgi:hypothetical protein